VFELPLVEAEVKVSAVLVAVIEVADVVVPDVEVVVIFDEVVVLVAVLDVVELLMVAVALMDFSVYVRTPMPAVSYSRHGSLCSSVQSYSYGQLCSPRQRPSTAQ
jgi:hypothetical protein